MRCSFSHKLMSARSLLLVGLAGIASCGLAVVFVWHISLALVPALDLEAHLKTQNLEERLSLSQIVVDRRGRLLRAFTARDGRWRLPVEAKQIAPHYYKLLLNFEDRGFYAHRGVEPKALLRAAWQFLRNGRIISGGSTLSMQVARLLEVPRRRSLLTKFRQIKLALQLEKRFSKAEILDLYLKLTPFGGNLEGVRAASLAYFGKEPARLSLYEAATLVALPQSPEGRRPDRFPIRAKIARNRVLHRAFESGIISEGDYLFAKRQKMVSSRLSFPMHAAHLSEKLVATDKKSAIVKTSISRPLQSKLEVLAQSHVQRYGKGLSSAILVVDHSNGTVLAHIGSADYRDHERFGPIDMTDRIRSPGSTLKPFIYGMGFDAGLAQPETLVEDAPIRFGLYAPENFDGKFHGTVTIRHALQKSLNIPAVKMLAALKPSRFGARFRYAGITSSMPHNLTVALGGVGFSLKDLTRAYLHIANPGSALDLIYTPENTRRSATKILKHRPLMSKKAAYYITHILRGAPPPKNAKPGALAYKTGTSYGYRDGWAVGYDGRHLVAVWIGRPDGGATTNLTGIGAAGPLLFDVFQHIGEKRVPFKAAPSGVTMASGEDLPPPMRVFGKDKKRLAGNLKGAGPATVKIAFPPKGAEFFLAHSRQQGVPIALKAEGGKLPFTWLVDGKVMPSKAYLRQNLFQVTSQGFFEFSVIDALGKTDRVQVRVR